MFAEVLRRSGLIGSVLWIAPTVAVAASMLHVRATWGNVHRMGGEHTAVLSAGRDETDGTDRTILSPWGGCGSDAFELAGSTADRAGFFMWSRPDFWLLVDSRKRFLEVLIGARRFFSIRKRPDSFEGMKPTCLSDGSAQVELALKSYRKPVGRRRIKVPR